jgi:hypothetical protein
MLQILYLLLEGLSVIVPALLAVAFIFINYEKISFKSSILIFFLLIIINAALFIYIFPSCNFSEYILNYDYINLTIKIKLKFLAYCEAISFYFFNSN